MTDSREPSYRHSVEAAGPADTNSLHNTGQIPGRLTLR